MENLYEKHLITDPNNQYLIEHSTRRRIADRVRTFRWYEPYLPSDGTILEWGCNHAPDSCLLRCSYGKRFSLHGCDFVPPDRYLHFYDYAGLSYTPLQDVVNIPYAPDSFDAVIGSGVLEHVAMDYESLKEIYRILKPDGVLIITYLPNWLSVNEWFRRVIRKKAFHRRLYRMSGTRQLLKRVGFCPVHSRYHTFLWDRILENIPSDTLISILNNLLTHLLPVHLFCSTLCIAAKKTTCM